MSDFKPDEWTKCPCGCEGWLREKDDEFLYESEFRAKCAEIGYGEIVTRKVTPVDVEPPQFFGVKYEDIPVRVEPVVCENHIEEESFEDRQREARKLLGWYQDPSENEALKVLLEMFEESSRGVVEDPVVIVPEPETTYFGDEAGDQFENWKPSDVAQALLRVLVANIFNSAYKAMMEQPLEAQAAYVVETLKPEALKEALEKFDFARCWPQGYYVESRDQAQPYVDELRNWLARNVL